ncbi:ATP-grasp domain-containing protein [bacterium]|nr:ATP-grasp domain-containing protein [bacterium]
MLPPMLFLTPRETEDTVAVGAAAREAGWRVAALESYRVPAESAGEANVAVYGGSLFAEAIAQQLNLALLEPESDWLARAPREVVKRTIRSVTAAEARRELSGRWFMKHADGKAFDADVMDVPSELPGQDALAASVPLLASEPVHWLHEFRFFVLEGEVLTGSVYLLDGRSHAGGAVDSSLFDQARGFVREAVQLAGDDVPPAFVMDVGLIPDRGWAVVELNPAFASGIYGCDPAAVLGVLQRCCHPVESLSPRDARWVIARKPSD